MGLAIDGNEVHGIARGGQAFVSIGNVNSTDGSLSIDGQDYKVTPSIVWYITWIC